MTVAEDAEPVTDVRTIQAAVMVRASAAEGTTTSPPVPDPVFDLRYGVRSHLGFLKDVNADSAYAGPYLVAIADVSEENPDGPAASTKAINALRALDVPHHEDELTEALARGLADAKAALGEWASSTTLTAMLWSGHTAALVLTDSARGYVLRDGELFQMNEDQNPVLRTVLAWDRYLLCSKGLGAAATEAQDIYEALRAHTEPHIAAQRLVELAMRKGGPDNVTCAVVDVVPVDPGAQPPAPVITGAVAGHSEPVSTAPPFSVPGYEIVAVLGEGGFGVVY